MVDRIILHPGGIHHHRAWRSARSGSSATRWSTTSDRPRQTRTDPRLSRSRHDVRYELAVGLNLIVKIDKLEAFRLTYLNSINVRKNYLSATRENNQPPRHIRHQTGVITAERPLHSTPTRRQLPAAATLKVAFNWPYRCFMRHLHAKLAAAPQQRISAAALNDKSIYLHVTAKQFEFILTR